jgi:hypothetical protein
MLGAISRRKRIIRDGVFVFGTLLVYLVFPNDRGLSPAFQSVLLSAVLFLALPLSYFVTVSREPLSSLGFRGSVRRFGTLSIPFVAISLLSIWYVAVRTFPVAESYAIPASVRNSFPNFLLYETLLVGTVSFLYEVFFRGTILLSWLRSAGAWAILIQAGIFAIFVAISGGGFSWQDVPLLLSSLGAGIVAYHTRSILYSWAVSWLMLFLADAIVLIS